MKHSASYFCNTDCEYYPCHAIGEGEAFNCLFCFCPLYQTDDCGGDFRILENGVKDCSACLIPHRPENYLYIIEKLK